MILILQIALGVFLDTLVSQFIIDGWHARQEGIAKEAAEKLRAEQKKVHQRIRAYSCKAAKVILLTQVSCLLVL